MVRGFVNDRGEPLIQVTLISKSGRAVRRPAVIDTGFNGALSVPEAVAKRLRWSWLGYESYEIATGDLVQEKMFLGRIRWLGEEREVYAVGSHARDVLIGTQLLHSNRLLIDFRTKRIMVSSA